MKIKLIGFFALVISFCFFAVQDSLAQSCTGDDGTVGECYLSVCPSGYKDNGTCSVGGETQICCSPETSNNKTIPSRVRSGGRCGTDNAGSCISGTACPSGYSMDGSGGCSSGLICCISTGAMPISGGGWYQGIQIIGLTGLPGWWGVTVEDVAENIMLWLLRIFTILAVISFIVCGIMFLMAGSNAGLAEKAKAGVAYSIIGVLVGISGYIVISQIHELLY